jgi:surface antigen
VTRHLGAIATLCLATLLNPGRATAASFTCSPVIECGLPIAPAFQGVAPLSNGIYQGSYPDCAVPDTGNEYQCTEFVNRFYWQALHVDTSTWNGAAIGYFPAAAERGLVALQNCATTVRPEPGDIVSFDPFSSDTLGHVAIVEAVTDTGVVLLEQNYSCSGTITLSLAQDPTSGIWTVGTRPRGQAVQGWMRLKKNFIPSPTFAAKFDLQTGAEPLGLVVADLDGDHKMDIAVTIYNNGNGDHLTIFRNTGSLGHLQFDPLTTDVPTGRGPEGLAAGDLDNDGKLDLVVANPGDSTITVLHNVSTQGLMDFEPVSPALQSPPTPHRVEIADFDGDGLPDIIVTSNNGRMVSVFHHGSDPKTISFDRRTDFGTSDPLNELAIADLDGDMKPEILVPLQNSGQLGLFQNISTPGNVQATALPSLMTGATPAGIAVADLNGDKKLDVVVTEAGGLAVFQNDTTSQGGPFLLARSDVLTGTNPQAIAIGDLANDGLPDVVAVNSSANTLTILQNTSAGNAIALTPLQPPLATGMNPINVVLGDVDGDALPDIVVATAVQERRGFGCELGLSR